MTNRAYYSDLIEDFLAKSVDEILGAIARSNQFSMEGTQRDAWIEQIRILHSVLPLYRERGRIYFEYAVPRLGKRIDVVVLIDHVIFVIEFKVGEKEFAASAVDQVLDYAVDLKNFHETTHERAVAPILLATKAKNALPIVGATSQNDGVLLPIKATVEQFASVLRDVLLFADGSPINAAAWEQGRYRPTPTIIEAAIALYGGHGVADISRSDAGAINLRLTSAAVLNVIARSRRESRKSICFVTGVPGAGKTLAGLDVAMKHKGDDRSSHDAETESPHSVFLSGNGPLVAILQEALARDLIKREANAGSKLKKGVAASRVKAFIQNVHHFRDDCLIDLAAPPVEHVAIFDEAQRAWDQQQTALFMLRKKQRPNFTQSEPEFLISCLDRHSDWAVVICLVGGGQEINTGEAGIGEWIQALERSFPKWDLHISSRLHDDEYAAGAFMGALGKREHVRFNDDLHLGVSMRSFRAENVSSLVKQVLDRDVERARATLSTVQSRYSIVVTRSLGRAKSWLKKQARGTERYGMVVSSQAQRLKPHAIHVKAPMDPIHWFLDEKDDVRSSYYLEDVATEFHVQGLELDWACVVWDADFRYSDTGWRNFSFVGSKWHHIHVPERQMYLKNAYRVLLTRARQGMVIVVPEGDAEDPTRNAAYYDPTFEYLRSVGFEEI